ncbi:glutathione-dependent formaldehyde dehydrogenase [Acrocarpospora phusangensis]|uniref:Glutathione-dependent formaldehyde dehydrogenase n=1 Tax=Acrocarpospora phusangensis TaxID=1070424 RepID=A0A919UVK0_9ACTN|nr:alcohol dehydrogenase catalytic domain-containing protein [Acrocarpospora phusangensis]GIH29480.1 glutathione-dependent formaldehyde dehydrogenase [Acrocarpospora phusangensis]
MKAVVWHDVGKIALDQMPDPRIQHPEDAIIRITASAICGTDLHFVRGTVPHMRPGTILGHEAVGLVMELGPGVRNFNPGDRVVVCSTIGCGRCSYCREGYYAQCDVANPKGSAAGTCFFGGPEETGPVDGLQAEYARIPYAHTVMVPVPPGVTDEQALMVSDIFPTGWFGGRLAQVGNGDVVVVLGAGPVGQLSALSARMQGAGRVMIVDGNADRLQTARLQNAETIDFNSEDPVAAVLECTGGIGADRVIDAVGVDAERPSRGPAATGAPHEEHLWSPGDAPDQALDWAVDMVAKAGTVGVIGVYPMDHHGFPLGKAMNRNLTVQMGNCNHRKYAPGLLSKIAAGHADPGQVVTQEEGLTSVIEAYQLFDRRSPGWTKVAIELP